MSAWIKGSRGRHPSDRPAARQHPKEFDTNNTHTIMFDPDYNMVGVAVAMVISTMHEKSCIDSHNARKFEKSSKFQSFTHLAITMMKLRKYHSHDVLKLS